jgi:serine/threonine-protein kinase
LTRVFSVQADIAEQIAEALDIALLGSEQNSIEWIPTDNLEAYNAYLKAEDAFWGLRAYGGAYQQAADLYQRALDLDSTFAAAYVGLGLSHILAEYMLYDRATDHKSLAKQALDRALDLDPNLAEGHFGIAWYYNNFESDRTRAKEELELAIKLKPSYAEAHAMLGTIHLFKGHFQLAVKITERAYHLDPRSFIVAISLCEVYQVLDRYVDADRLYERLLMMDSTSVMGWLGRARMHLMWKGDAGKVRRTLQSAPGVVLKNPVSQYMLGELDFLNRNFEEALGHFPDGVPSTTIDSTVYYIQRGEILHYMDDDTGSRACFDSLYSIVKQRRGEDEVRRNWSRDADLAWAYAGLGMRTEALKEIERIMGATDASEEVRHWADIAASVSQIYLMMGEYENALDLVDQLLAVPNDEISVAILEIDPRFDAVRNSPRFQALLEKYDSR